MPNFQELNNDQRNELIASLEEKYQVLKSKNLSLDITRGKPSSEQLSLCNEILSLPADTFLNRDGIDCRNYGGLEGLIEAREIFAEILQVQPEQVIVGNNASLTLMYDSVSRAMLFGVPDGDTPWSENTVKFLCPVPGYDRHFSICEQFNIEMIQVPLNDDGPDMQQVENLLAADDSIKGMWCVPKYSNPTGAVYSDEVITRLANMKAAKDFRLFWDNAYAEHHLDKAINIKSILDACTKAGNKNRPLIFGSTSKISMAGSGISALAASDENISDTKKHLAIQTIGSDKINQLRHVQMFKNIAGLREHMKKHAAILKPKFDIVLNILHKNLADVNIAIWTKPKGGYFISLDLQTGCAKEVVNLAKGCGVKLTPAGATFPYKKDDLNRNIRIAPSFPNVEELKLAMEVVVICIQIASLQSLSSQQ